MKLLQRRLNGVDRAVPIVGAMMKEPPVGPLFTIKFTWGREWGRGGEGGGYKG